MRNSTKITGFILGQKIKKCWNYATYYCQKSFDISALRFSIFELGFRNASHRLQSIFKLKFSISNPQTWICIFGTYWIFEFQFSNSSLCTLCSKLNFQSRMFELESFISNLWLCVFNLEWILQWTKGDWILCFSIMCSYLSMKYAQVHVQVHDLLSLMSMSLQSLTI